MWLGDLDLKSQLTLAIAVGSGGLALALAVRSKVMRPLQTLANLTASLRERDYAVRGCHARGDDSLGLAIAELAQRDEELRDERWCDEEAAAGLARVVEGLDAAVIAVDRDGVVRLAPTTRACLGIRSRRPARLLSSVNLIIICS